MHHIRIAPAGAEEAHQAFIVPDTRAAIELAVEAFLQRLDEMDGEPDEETTGSEDDFIRHEANGAGCPIADAGGGAIEDQPHDEEEDCCLAGDDGIFAGPAIEGPVSQRQRIQFSHWEIGSEEDAELNGDETDGERDPNE